MVRKTKHGSKSLRIKSAKTKAREEEMKRQWDQNARGRDCESCHFFAGNETECVKG